VSVCLSLFVPRNVSSQIPVVCVITPYGIISIFWCYTETSERSYYKELNRRDVNRHSWVYCNTRGDYMFRLSGKAIVRLNINVSNIQATTMPCNFWKIIVSRYIILCHVITQAIIVWAAPALTSWTFMSFYRYIWFCFYFIYQL